MTKDVTTKVKKIIVNHLKIEESKVTNKTNFINNLNTNSLNTVELIMAFKKEFGSEISDNKTEKNSNN